MQGHNRVTLIGRLGADPDIRHTKDGRKLASFRVAASESWKDKQTNERKERTEWVTVVAYTPGLAELIEQRLKKGSSVFVEGKFQTRKWQDQSGADRYTTEVVVQNNGGTVNFLDSGEAAPQKQRSYAAAGESYEDDIPF